MKKTIFFALLFILTFPILFAQGNTTIGITAGYINAATNVDAGGIEFSDNQSGFYGGLTIEIPIVNDFMVQPEFLYANINDTSFLQVPLMVKYYAAEDIYLQAGPQITYIFEDAPDNFTEFNLGLGAGIGYEFTSKIYANAKYMFQINNFYTGSEDITSRMNLLNVGLGYKFN